MFKKLLSVLVLTLSIFTSTYAGTPEINWGPANANKSLNSIFQSVKIGSDFYIYTEYKKKPEFHIVDGKSLTLTKSKEVVFAKEKGSTFDVYDLVSIANKPYLLYTDYNKDSDLTTLYAVEFDFESPSVNTSKSIMLASEKSKSRKKQADFISSYSPDSSYLAFQGIPTIPRKEAQKFSFQVLNTKTGKIKEAVDVELPFKSKAVEFMNFQIDNLGNIHALLQVDLLADKVFKSEYVFKLFTYYTADKKLKEQEIDFQGKYITNPYISVDANNNLKFAGFYADKNALTMKGYFYIKLNVETKKISKSIFNEFDKSVNEQVIGARRAKKGKLMPIFTIRDIFEQEDGGTYIISEYYSYHSTSSQTATTEIWTYGSVLVIDVANSGKTNWVSVIPKSQVATKSSPNIGALLGGFVTVNIRIAFKSNEQLKYYGISSFVKNGQLVILFNGNHKDKPELGEEGIKVMRNYKKSILKTVEIDAKTGAETYSQDSKDPYVYIPGLSYQFSPKRALVISELKDQFKFGILEL